MGRNYAAIPHDYLEEMEELTDEEFGRLVRGILRYSMTGESFSPVGNERFYVKRVKIAEDNFQTAFDETDRKKSERAKKAAEARWGNAKASASMQEDTQACSSMLTDACDAKNKYNKNKLNINKDNKEKEIYKEKEKRFVPPTVEEVEAYIKEKGYQVDAEKFVAYYESKGWLVGKSPMKSWKAALVTWKKNSFGNQNKNQSGNGFLDILREMDEKEGVISNGQEADSTSPFDFESGVSELLPWHG